jgi:hypothetical protein
VYVSCENATLLWNSVAEMTNSVWVTRLGSEFDDFLFAPIREEGNGMLLTVISAFARLDLDPWQEATKLAGLPEKAAIERLMSLIATLPDGLTAHQAPGTIAERLVALLPHRISPDNASSKMLFDARAGIYNMYVVFFVFMLVAQWIVASQQPPAHDDANTPAPIIVSPQTPPSSGQ